MFIETLRIRNFRCFGEAAAGDIIHLDPSLTAFVGANGAGKTTVILALLKLFGTRGDDRRLTREDVHFGPDEEPGIPELDATDEEPRLRRVQERQVEIEVTLGFPELDRDDDEGLHTIPDVFRAMAAGGPAAPLKARIRLEAKWAYGVDEDDIETKVYWITSLGPVPFGERDVAKVPMPAAERHRFRVRYLPATRDGAAIVRQALRELLSWLENVGDWESGRAPMAEQWQQLQALFDDMPAMRSVAAELRQNWGRLFDGHHVRSPRLTVIAREIQRALRELSLTLGPGPDGRHRSVQELSEGQASLFYIALVVTLMRLEEQIASSPQDGFKPAEAMRPWLTIIALEEPENHLAPFYLSRMIGLILELARDFRGMGIITTHAPGALRRVSPSQVRYVRQDTTTLASCVRAIPLPGALDEQHKFVQEAVQAHPELYFAKFVVLGEGRSEEIVIPRVARSLDPSLDLDPAFVAFVPLGGRHVNHFWRLLDGLQIPYVTLLDDDLGRANAGPLRLKYAVDQLEARGRALPALERPPNGAGWRALPANVRILWREWLRTQGVFFSLPLDLDMMLLQAFSDAYGPPPAGEAAADDACLKSVFGKGPGKIAYNDFPAPSDADLLRYDVLFKKGSKPVAHIQALLDVPPDQLRENCPEPIKRLVESCLAAIAPAARNEPALAGLPT